MSYQSRVRTPEVPFGDKFEVMIRFVLVKEGPEKVKLVEACRAMRPGRPQFCRCVRSLYVRLVLACFGVWLWVRFVGPMQPIQSG